jgi:hypothetical protein
MKNLTLRKNAGGIEILGFPDAASVVRLSGRKSDKLADLGLHHTDLEFAGDCLRSLADLPDEPPTLREAMWRCAVIHFMKCFGDSKSRSSLNAKRLYKSQPGKAFKAFEFIDGLRNKHLVHDDNPFTECIPGAILNRADAERKIADIVCLHRMAGTLSPTNYKNLNMLINVARQEVERLFDELVTKIKQDLEKESYETLAALEPVRLTGVAAADVLKTRRIRR